nr:MAG TPA: hypothetical protein [Caudoviricetes sp.]
MLLLVLYRYINSKTLTREWVSGDSAHFLPCSYI